MSSNEFSIQKLDENFKMGLQIIRRNINNLTHPQDAKLCGEWLQKLRDSTDERRLRNILLQKLTSQVQNNCLEYPFDSFPEEGPLYALLETDEVGSFLTDDDITSNLSLQDGNNMNLQYEGCQFIQSTDQFRSNVHIPVFPKKGPETTKIKEENSCKYLSQVDKIKMDQQEKKINSLMNTVAELRVKNDSLGREVESLKKLSKDTEGNFIKAKTDAEKKNVEIEKLTLLVENYKNLLTDYKKIVNDNVSCLADRLSTAIDRNSALQVGLENLKSSMYSFWSSKIKIVENELTSEIKVFESKLSVEREKYSSEVTKLRKMVEEKNSEIEVMDSQIKRQCSKMKDKMKRVIKDFNETNRESEVHYKKKNEFLKKKIAKLEKLNRKIIEEYEKKIAFLSKDHECKVKALKHHEADKLVFELEAKLKSLEADYRQLYSGPQCKMISSEAQKEVF